MTDTKPLPDRLHDRVDEARKANLWDHELLYAELHRQIDALLVEWERERINV